MQIIVSPAGFSDWPQLLGLLRESFAYMQSRIDPPSSLTRMDIDSFKVKAAEETLIVAMEGRTLIGCAFAAVQNECVYIGKVAVAQPARSKGVARAMLAAAEDLARKHGREQLELQTRIELVENHATFGALGFEKVAETAHPGYNRPTSITMRKRVAEIAAEHVGQPRAPRHRAPKYSPRMNSTAMTFRRALESDLPAIVRLLADDPLGATRESFESPLPAAYHHAFAAIDGDPNNELVVVVDETNTVVGVLQMTFIPYLTYRGGWRALIEGVRVASSVRSSGVGRQLFEWAIRRAMDRNCHMVQLTSDKARPDAIRFYETLGFKPSHEGLKMHLPPGTDSDT